MSDQTALRDRIAAALYAHDHPSHVVPLNETGMEAAYQESADAVLAVLPAPPGRAEYNALVDEADRLRREGAALHARAEGIDKQLAALQKQVAAPVDRRAVLREAADIAEAQRQFEPAYGARKSAQVSENVGILRVAAELRRVADETAATATQPADLPALAAALDGFATLLATSSRDWGVYRVDAWLYAVICGWDCEQTEHDDTCVHGALEEMAELHGWDDATVAKARRYRAAVRALVETHQPAAEQPFVPPVHYRRDDGVGCCVHAIPVGPDSCRACRELADAEAAAGARRDGAPS